jgi:spore germination protein GerM
VSLIPEGTRLLSVRITDGIASLCFSSDFADNRYGGEGYLGQLEQIVYTATAFPTVQSVQFLIDGEKRDYIGGEGVWIGSPLSRASFR